MSIHHNDDTIAQKLTIVQKLQEHCVSERKVSQIKTFMKGSNLQAP